MGKGNQATRRTKYVLENHLTIPARGMPKPPLRSGFVTPAGGVRFQDE